MRSAPTHENHRRRGARGVLVNRHRTADTPNLAAQGQSVSRKTVAEVPLTGLSLNIYLLFEGGPNKWDEAVQVAAFNLSWLLDGRDIATLIGKPR